MTTSLGQTVLMNDLTPVRVVAVTNVAGTYNNGQTNTGAGATLTVAASSLTIDSVVLVEKDRVLLQNQTAPNQNGIYIVRSITTTVVLQRAEDQQNIEQLKPGQFTIVGAGTVNAGAIFSLIEPLPQTIGVDSFLWTPASVTGSGGLSDTLANGNIFVGNGSNIATSVTPTGDITLSNTGLFGIASGVIINTDINASAAIAYSKLATLASGNILVGSAGGVATSVAMSGVLAISNTGVTSFAALSIVNADISATAAIAFSKLAALPSTQILVGSAGNVPTAVTVTGDVTIGNTGVTAIGAGKIVNAQVNASAAIAFSKLATLATGHLLAGNAGVVTDVTLGGDATIGATGTLTIANDAITTAKILAANVTLAKLAAGITPSHIIKFGGTQANGGGSATIAITVTGTLVSDLPFVQIQTSTNAVTVQKVTPTADTVTVLLSGDPGAATVLSYQVLRAAA